MNLLFATLNYRESTPPLWRRFLWKRRGDGESRIHQHGDSPSLIGHANGLRWRRAEGFMDAAEIVVRDVQRDRRNVVIQLL